MAGDQTGGGWGQRHLQVGLLFLGICVSYMQRINLSICIVDMTASNSTRGFPVYEWSQSERGVVLSSFFWGYVLMQVPGGMLSQRFGPRVFLLGGLAGSSLLSLLVPLGASLGGWRLVCALRMMAGMCQGIVYPSTHSMLGRWVPPLERGRATTITYSGMSLGTVSMMAGGGALAASPLGWPAGFYVPGAIGLLWALLGFFFVSNSPRLCKRISPDERKLILEALGTSAPQQRQSVPWKSILTSVPMLSVMTAHFVQNFGHWLMLTQMPNYLKEVLQFNIAENGLNSALPYLGHFLASQLFAAAAQQINRRRLVSVGASRKLFNSLGQYGGGTVMLLLAFVKVPPSVAIVLLTVIVSLEAAILAGFVVNMVDLSPTFSGPMMGLSNAIGNLSGIIAPIFVSLVVGDSKNLPLEAMEWRWSVVFMTAGGLFICGNTVFLCGASGEVQPWNQRRASCASHTDGPEAGRELLEKNTLKDGNFNSESKQIC